VLAAIKYDNVDLRTISGLNVTSLKLSIDILNTSLALRDYTIPQRFRGLSLTVLPALDAYAGAEFVNETAIRILGRNGQSQIVLV
jgi:hypothetical protein